MIFLGSLPTSNLTSRSTVTVSSVDTNGMFYINIKSECLIYCNQFLVSLSGDILNKILDTIIEVKLQVAELVKRQNQRTSINGDPKYLDELKTLLPIKSIEEFNKLEMFLQTEENKTYLVRSHRAKFFNKSQTEKHV